MKRMILLLVLAALAVLSSCGRYSAGREELRDIASYADANPDSARISLERMNRRLLVTSSLRARHALLYSQALDRCHIYITDDSIATVAVNHFQKIGKAEDRYKSLYYRGRVYEHAQAYDSALRDYIRAEAIKSPKVSLRFRTSNLLKQYSLYLNQDDDFHAEQAARSAAHYARLTNWDRNYNAALYDLSKLYLSQKRFEEADSCISLLRKRVSEMDQTTRIGYEQLELWRLIYENGNSDSLLNRTDFLVNTFKEDSTLLPWSTIAQAYEKTGRYEKAFFALKAFQKHSSDAVRDMVYYSILSSVLDSLGNSDASKEAYKKYLVLSDSAHVSILEQNVSSLEEKHRTEVRNMRMRWGIALTGIGFLAVLLFGWISVSRGRKEHARLQKLYTDLQEELSVLKLFQAHQSELGKEAAAALGERVKSLSHFLMQEPPASLERVSSQLETLTANRRELLDTIGMLFAIYHPAFVTKLSEHGLTTTEVGYCCLLALGVRSGEIGDIINRSGVYNIAGGIKAKFGELAAGQSLATTVKKIYEET